MAVTARRRRQRTQPQRLDPHPAGSADAIRIVRAYIGQQQRLRAGRSSVDSALGRRHPRADKAWF